MQYYSAIKKEQNNASCNDMDGPRNCHNEWSRSDRERQIYDIANMWNLKKPCRWTYLQNGNWVKYRKEIYGYQRWGRDKLGDWDWHIYTNIHKIDN